MWKSLLLVAALTVTGCVGCSSSAATQPKPPVAATQSAKAELPKDVKTVLTELSKAHQEKVKLGTFAGSVFLPVDEPFKPFFKNMGTQQKELLADLRAWAKTNNFDLVYVFPPDAYGRARKSMEQKQEAISRASKKEAFQRDMLMHMYHDYEWQICLIEAIQPTVTDPTLSAYLSKSHAVHKAGSAEITALLKHYKYVN